MRRFVLVVTISLLVFFLSAFIEHEQGNTIPKIALQLKSGQKTFSQGVTLQYSIAVEDKEDGSSKYEEIAGNEVFLQLKYLPDSGMLKKYLETQQRDAPVLILMKKGTCFNCHALKKRMVGPSFAEILSKYPKQPAITDYLAGKIINGSKGVWGDSQVMPSHPEISKEQGKAIADWILKQAADPDYDLQTGLEGKFTPKASATPGEKSVYVLVSTYLDHGSKGAQALEGRQVLTLPYKKTQP
ncbi:c-type cytochrome [Flavihumibacter fluvii]|uniref:c-type cytochrome n=1 Tax=Flavihumibacter fluvii TaxID=2838157 RepID=UPI001BDEC690|nr:c-type cytochrome [Flavihumibacter fluvii]ULQ51297.1 hypothetical protein KJS93_14495 [Flavihumibacter fluvii]